MCQLSVWEKAVSNTQGLSLMDSIKKEKRVAVSVTDQLTSERDFADDMRQRR